MREVHRARACACASHGAALPPSGHRPRKDAVIGYVPSEADASLPAQWLPDNPRRSQPSSRLSPSPFTMSCVKAPQRCVPVREPDGGTGVERASNRKWAEDVLSSACLCAARRRSLPCGSDRFRCEARHRSRPRDPQATHSWMPAAMKPAALGSHPLCTSDDEFIALP